MVCGVPRGERGKVDSGALCLRAVMSCQVSAPGTSRTVHPHNTSPSTSLYPDTAFLLPRPDPPHQSLHPFAFSSKATCSCAVPACAVPISSDPACRCQGSSIRISPNCVQQPVREVPLGSPRRDWLGEQGSRSLDSAFHVRQDRLHPSALPSLPQMSPARPPCQPKFVCLLS